MSLQIKVGTYTGTGSALSITGLDFRPKALFIKGGANIAQLCLDVMGADKTQPLTGGTTYYAGGVTSLDAAGFTLGTNAAVNTNTTVYYYIALTDTGGASLKTGTYVGNSAVTTITGVGFKPDFITWSDDVGDTPVFKTTTMAADAVSRYDIFGILTTRVTSLTNDGFVVAAANEVNTTARNYYYLAIKNVPNLFKVFSYTGTGADDLPINGATFQPDSVVTREVSVGSVAAMRFKDEVGDNSFLADATGEAANRIQAFATDGFQAGTVINVNAIADIYHAFVFKSGTSGSKLNNSGLRPHPFSPGLAR